MRSRCCSRTACKHPPVYTLTYVYRESTAVLGPLAAYVEPHCYDLCEKHAARLTAPPRRATTGKTLWTIRCLSGSIIPSGGIRSPVAEARTIGLICQGAYKQFTRLFPCFHKSSQISLPATMNCRR